MKKQYVNMALLQLIIVYSIKMLTVHLYKNQIYIILNRILSKVIMKVLNYLSFFINIIKIIIYFILFPINLRTFFHINNI